MKRNSPTVTFFGKRWKRLKRNSWVLVVLARILLFLLTEVLTHYLRVQRFVTEINVTVSSAPRAPPLSEHLNNTDVVEFSLDMVHSDHEHLAEDAFELIGHKGGRNLFLS